MKRPSPVDLSNRIQLDQAFNHLIEATRCLDRVKGGLDAALAGLKADSPSRELVLRAFIHMIPHEPEGQQGDG